MIKGCGQVAKCVAISMVFFGRVIAVDFLDNEATSFP